MAVVVVMDSPAAREAAGTLTPAPMEAPARARVAARVAARTAKEELEWHSTPSTPLGYLVGFGDLGTRMMSRVSSVNPAWELTTQHWQI